MAYPGGKGKSFRHLINLMPTHECYIEPFVGGGSVVGNKLGCSKTLINDVDPLVVSALKLRNLNAEVSCLDAITFLKGIELTSTTLIYCDPPYVHSTRKKKKIYRYEYTDNQHEKLLKFLIYQRCMVMISGYDNELYNDILVGWEKREFQAQTQDGLRNECIWMNYPEPKELHDSRYLGQNFRERQNVKRRIERLQTKVSGMCPVERAHFIDWLSRTYA